MKGFGMWTKGGGGVKLPHKIGDGRDDKSWHVRASAAMSRVGTEGLEERWKRHDSTGDGGER